jgi:protein DA1
VTTGDAREQVAIMLEWVRKTGVPIRQNVNDIKLRMVNGETLSDRSGGSRHVGQTDVRWTQVMSVRRYNISIALVAPMPQTLFRGALAHELGHVWLMTESITKLSELETEGFCELLAYLYFSGESAPEAKSQISRMQENPDPVYGDGFRHVLAIYKRTGLEAIVRSLLKASRLS